MDTESFPLDWVAGAAAALVAGWATMRGAAAIATAAIYLTALWGSPVRRETLLAGFSIAALRSVLLMASVYIAWLVVIWSDMMDLHSGGFISLVAAIGGLFFGSFGLRTKIAVARTVAWERGAAEDLEHVSPDKHRQERSHNS